MARVTLTNVSKVYPRAGAGGATAVEDVSLDIADGEFVVLVGPSGCGKSTTLRMIAGLEDLSAGTISIDGRVVNDVAPKDRDIAMVFQNYALYPHMTVRKNMGFALKMRRVPRAEIAARVEEVARLLGVEDLLQRKPGELSGGQRQRVALGRAIVRRPKVFLFDEPLSNLDAKLRVAMRTELKSLHARLRTTCVYVTHDQEEAMTLGDRIVVMCDRRIQQIASPLQVFKHPANRFVASFLGMPQMNFLDGAIERRAGRAVFVADGGERFAFTPESEARLRTPEGYRCVVGFRPGALAERAAEGGSENSISLTPDVLEPLGESIDVIGRTASNARVVARIAAREGLKAGEKLSFTVAPESLHLFEPGAFGANLLAAARG